MRLHLVVPGMLWPSRALYDTTFDLELPALSQLMSRGSARWREPQPIELFLCRLFGIDGDPPYAALRLLGENGLPAPGRDIWMCADFAELAIEQQRLVLASGDTPISDDEMKALGEALGDTLHAHVQGCDAFVTAACGRAYLRLARMPLIATTPPSAAAGQTIEHAAPHGEEARRWAHLGNELSMRLATLPLNQRREAAGLPVINALWFWGAGVLPAPRASRHAPYDELCGDEPLAAGIANWAGIPVRAAPAHGAELPGSGSILVLLPQVEAAAAMLDATTWRAGMSALERDWFAPLRARLAAGAIEALRVTALGADASLEIVAATRDRLKFWRAAKPLHRLLAPQQ